MRSTLKREYEFKRHQSKTTPKIPRKVYTPTNPELQALNPTLCKMSLKFY